MDKESNVINEGRRDWEGLSVFTLKTYSFFLPSRFVHLILEVEIVYKTTQVLCFIPLTITLNLKNSNLRIDHSTLQVFLSYLISSWRGSPV